METTQETGLQRFETIVSLVKNNKPVIAEKIKKAIDTLTLIIAIDTEEQDTFANSVLVKCNATLPVVEGLRKEYTSILDEWKKGEMALESTLKKEMDRVRTLRNDRANKIAEANRVKAAEIERTKNHEKEVARIKNQMVQDVEIGVAQRINQGEQAIVGIINGMTLETFDVQAKRLDFKPALKEDLFRGFLAVDYDQNIVPYDEFKEIVDKAFVHFDFKKCNEKYVEAVLKVVAKWKATLPAKRKELEVIAKATGEQAELLKQAAAKMALRTAQELSAGLATQEGAIKEKAKEAQSNAVLDAEFKSQIAAQGIQEQSGVRGVISYRLADENPMRVVEAISRAMINVFADPAFKGIYKRDKAGIPKRDDKGQAEYIDPIQGWLDLLAKVKPSPEFEGVVKTEDKTTIAKS